MTKKRINKARILAGTGGGAPQTLSERFASLRKSAPILDVPVQTTHSARQRPKQLQQQQPQQQQQHFQVQQKNQHQVKASSVLNRLGAAHVLKRLGAPKVPIQQRLGAKAGAPKGPAAKRPQGASAKQSHLSGLKGSGNRKKGQGKLSKESLDSELDKWKLSDQATAQNMLDGELDSYMKID
ncbi:hypothetical protein HDU97_004625 [Phlyctochytrium planicorne]|nr:hypothetical protein HDU97_004625 [Phlyctochytrium planicorne]